MPDRLRLPSGAGSSRCATHGDTLVGRQAGFGPMRYLPPTNRQATTVPMGVTPGFNLQSTADRGVSPASVPVPVIGKMLFIRENTCFFFVCVF